MKLHELKEAISMLPDDIDVEVCQFTDTDVKYYWMSSCFYRDNYFIIGYNVDSLRKRNNNAV